MASTYGYATLADLEKYAHIDYSAIDGTYLGDTYVEAAITNAEKFINGYIGTTFTGTIPDAIELVTKMIAKIFLDNFMIEQKIGPYADSTAIKIDILDQFDIMQILEQYKQEYSQTRGVFVSKQNHTARSNYWSRRPTGWQ